MQIHFKLLLKGVQAISRLFLFMESGKSSNKYSRHLPKKRERNRYFPPFIPRTSKILKLLASNTQRLFTSSSVEHHA